VLKQTIEILSSFENPKKVCVMGNVALSRGAIEAGVNGVFSYPGTPSTEISEVFKFVNQFQSSNGNQEKYPELNTLKIYFEYSINEKIALEKAIAYSIGNRSAMCVMKNVGMNVASDALMSITYQSIIGPLVIVLCDDPGCFSSSNEQDSRHWAEFASVPMFVPRSPADAYEMTKDAFELSAQLRLPVILRLTTRVSHSRGELFYNIISPKTRTAEFEALPVHINIPARTAVAHKTLLGKLNNSVFSKYNSRYNICHEKQARYGIITNGTPDLYVREVISQFNMENECSIFHIGLLHPFPDEVVKKFLSQGFEKIIVFEELDAIVENQLRRIAQKEEISCKIYGKGFSELSVTGEYNLEIVEKVITEFCSIDAEEFVKKPLEGIAEFLEKIPPRPPALCAGCPHRATFYALKLAIPRGNGSAILCGDIGCFGLGALPPLQMIDTINHMGMSISMAQGLSEALEIKNKLSEKRVVALLGDGTFFHSGIASLLNAVYTKANLTVIIFDNRTIGMTGHQPNPGVSENSKYKQIDIYSLVKGCGVESVEYINPYELKDTYTKVKKAVDSNGVSVLISQSPCIFLHEFKEGSFSRKRYKVDPAKCNSCHNHNDWTLSCSRQKSSQSNLVRARAKITAKSHVHGLEQLCPANICNHGFFNSVLSGNYKEALEIVRDKMLFASVCGDICHKPCESLFRVSDEQSNDNQSIPIKNLKHFVSSIPENFEDFSAPIERAKKAERKNKRVAIIGAGPAGLSAAYDLSQAGYDITIFEREDSAGGVVKHIIPNFRINKFAMDKEIAVLVEMGVQFKFSTEIGNINNSKNHNVSLNDLRSDFNAVLLATGIWNSPVLDVLIENLPQERHTNSLKFLRNFNKNDFSLPANCSNILVVGGGNSAMDAARAAKKLPGIKDVFVSCLESSESMPAFADEVKSASLEGINIFYNSSISHIDKQDESYNVQLNSYDTNEKIIDLKVDFVISAIGQNGDKEFINNKFETDGNSRVLASESKDKIFFAGDIVSGNHISLIGAIGSGKRAAVEVRKALDDYTYEYEGSYALNKLNTASAVNKSGNKVSYESITEIIGDDIYDFDLFQSCYKCDHCIENFGCPAMQKVDGKVVIDESRCTNCGLCVDVCPNNAIFAEEY